MIKISLISLLFLLTIINSGNCVSPYSNKTYTRNLAELLLTKKKKKDEKTTYIQKDRKCL